MLLIVATALAARPDFGFTVGWESVTNDPFAASYGPRMGFNVGLAHGIEFGAAASYYPLLGSGGCSDPRWTDLACQLLENNSVSPDISLMNWTADVNVRVLPFRATYGRWEASAGIMAGVGMVATQDDLVALQAVGEPQAEATADQIHGAAVGGLIGQIRYRFIATRFYARDLAYIETVYSSTLEMKHNSLLGTEVAFWF